jgi:uncharacterized Zn-finger protein
MVREFSKAMSMNHTVTATISATSPPPEVIHVTEHRVVCDGGNGALGHPRVFLEMGEATEVTCPYCDRLFVLAGDGH